MLLYYLESIAKDLERLLDTFECSDMPFEYSAMSFDDSARPFDGYTRAFEAWFHCVTR